MAELNPAFILNGVVYALTGLVLFAVAVTVIGRAVPIDLWKEVGENRNTAAAILTGALSIAIAIIIASAVH